MRTVIVTGSSGFIGSHVAEAFTANGDRVVGIDRSPASGAVPSHHQVRFPSPDLVGILTDEAPDVLVHCAGSASVPASFEATAEDFSSTVDVTFHVLDALRIAAPACHVIYPSSAAVYGQPSDLPIDEDAAIQPLSPYGFHKRQAEVLCQEASALYGLPTTVFRIFSAYGPGLRRQVVWDICRMAMDTGKVRLEGDGTESRDFIHVADIADAMVALSSSPDGHRILNLASGNETTIAALAQLTLDALGIAAEVEASGIASLGKPTHWRANIEMLLAAGFTPTIDMPSGIADTTAWAREAPGEEHGADLP